MRDLVFVAVGLGFFLVTGGLAAWFERLRGSRR
jgi:hypothetical protein